MSADTNPQSGKPERKEVPPVTLKGNLGRDPEYKTVASTKEPDAEIPLGKFSLAVNSTDGQTTWYDVIAWRQLALNMQQLPLATGAFVEVTGKETTKEITLEDGTKRTVHEVTLTKLPTVLRAAGGARRTTPPAGSS
jgi:single-stranded DNA-binding protein